MRALSLFSGGLGLDLGLEEAGIEAACYVEADPDCLRLIRARRPGVPVVEDVKAVTAETLAAAGAIDVVAGGFPCQDLSYAGRGAGLHEGERSALWFEMLRIVEDVRPRLVLAENVPGLLTRGLPVVLHGLARAGYVGRWFAVSAASVGAPHLRERIFVVARRGDAGVRAERLGAGHPVGEFRDDGWFDLQGSLFDQEPLRRLGKRGRWTLEAVFEEDARLALDDGAEETLLPTPSAYESTPTAEYVDEVREAGVDPEARLYLPGRRWHAQRTLSRIAPLVGEVGREGEALLPTPGANDSTGAEGETREKRQQTGKTGGGALRDIPYLLAASADAGRVAGPEAGELDGGPGEGGEPSARGEAWEAERRASGCARGGGGAPFSPPPEALLPTPAARDAKGPNPNDRDGGDDLPTAAQKLLPTPVVTDSFGSRRSTARTDEWTSNPGTTLTDAIWEAQGRETDTTGKLLPTPTAADDNRMLDHRHKGGNHTLQSAAYELADPKLLPTPVANPDNPGAGGELRAAIEHGPERRNGTGVDSLGRPNEGRPSRLLPTPQAADGDGGRQEKGAMRAGGKRPSGQKGTLPLGTAVTLADEIGESPFTEQEPTETLLPTPETVNRKSRRAMTSSGAGDGNGKRSGGGMSSPPGLEQVAEIVTGSESRDLPDYEDLPPSTREIVDSVEGGISWGVYEAAIRRWEATCGREAPAPTDEKGRLAPDFVEWMMDYPEGWISGLVLPDKDPRPDQLSRTAALRILGNSVVVRVGYRAGLALLALDRELTA